MGEKFADLPEALASTLEVADMCDLKLALGATLLPPFDVPDGLTPDQYLTKMVADGLKWRHNGEPSTALKKPSRNALPGTTATRYASRLLRALDLPEPARSPPNVGRPEPV